LFSCASLYLADQPPKVIVDLGSALMALRLYHLPHCLYHHHHPPPSSSPPPTGGRTAASGESYCSQGIVVFSLFLFFIFLQHNSVCLYSRPCQTLSLTVLCYFDILELAFERNPTTIGLHHLPLLRNHCFPHPFTTPSILLHHKQQPVTANITSSSPLVSSIIHQYRRSLS
jgi:hypothetical protein